MVLNNFVGALFREKVPISKYLVSKHFFCDYESLFQVGLSIRRHVPQGYKPEPEKAFGEVVR